MMHGDAMHASGRTTGYSVCACFASFIEQKLTRLLIDTAHLSLAEKNEPGKAEGKQSA